MISFFTSSTYKLKKTGVGGQPSLESKSINLAPPIFITMWIITPSWFVILLFVISSASNEAVKKSIKLGEDGDLIQGVTVV